MGKTTSHGRNCVASERISSWLVKSSDDVAAENQVKERKPGGDGERRHRTRFEYGPEVFHAPCADCLPNQCFGSVGKPVESVAGNPHKVDEHCIGSQDGVAGAGAGAGEPGISCHETQGA